ncbi:MAG: nucleotidyl transferase AbiEii/AbiGii toxin family protein [Bacteriovoracaceae bacterium]|nr:nucleotidyl transferase AbiEii/AbiGii toxin family protein [Bacteriovoracaceae bacterium]
MNLHEHKEEFLDLITLTSSHFKISPVLVEKDYWVTFALKKLSKSDIASKVVFKGGTSLSKAHHLIKRFSEDIDLALIVEEGDSSGQIKSKLKKIEKACAQDFVEVTDDPRTSKGSKFRKTVWRFSKGELTGEYGDAGENILLEVNSFTIPEPHEDLPIESLVAEFLKSTNQQDVIEEFNLQPFSIAVLKLERTFVEKISAITKASYRSADDNYSLLSKNIRHFYDLVKLYDRIGKGVISDHDEFSSFLERVKIDDKVMDAIGEWSLNKYGDADVFQNVDEVWKIISPAYRGVFKTMLYGDEKLPEEVRVKDVINSIKDALGKIELNSPI